MSQEEQPAIPSNDAATEAGGASVTKAAEAAVARLRGAAARSASGEKLGGRPAGARDLKPRKRRSDFIPTAAKRGDPLESKPLTVVQAHFAALWVSGQVGDTDAVEQAYRAAKLEVPTRDVCRRKAERWLGAVQVKAEIERVAQISSVPSAALAAIARRQLKALLFCDDAHTRHQAVMTALRLNGDLRPQQNGTLGGGREGPSIGTIIINQLSTGGQVVTDEALARALADALGRSGEPNALSLHRHAEGAMPLLPPGEQG